MNNIITHQDEINVGVDTGKHQLDIFIRPLGIELSVANNHEGIHKALKTIKIYRPARVIIEATGRLETEFVIACSKAKLPIVVANPMHIKKFSGATGQLAKTDRLDAKQIAHYGEAIKPPLTCLKPEIMRQISDLLARRKQLLSMQTMEKNRLQVMPKTISASIKPILTVFKNQLDKLERKLLQLVENCDEYRCKNEILQSMPGVGKVLALTLLSNMPELGFISNKEAAALVGVAPINRDSGSCRGHRRIRGGRHQIRTVMYMAMLSAIQCNPLFKATFHRLVKKGKSKKTAIIACVRKMVVILNAMIRDGACWNAKQISI